MSLSRIRVLIGALGLIAIAIGVPGAIASQIGFGGYIAGSGETNQLTVTSNPGTGAYTYTDTGVATIGYLPDAAGCVVAGNQATCPTRPGIFIDLKDGNDSLDLRSSGSAYTFVSGGPGNDHLISGPGGSDLVGGTSDGTVITYGELGTGDDVLESVGGFADRFHPGDGNDTLIGSGDRDNLFGDLGNDTVIGGAGPDQIDTFGIDIGLSVREGSDTLEGGPGNDTFSGVEQRVNAADVISCGEGDDLAEFGPSDSVSGDCEVVRQFVLCPASAFGQCAISAAVTTAGATPPSAAAAASAAAKRGTRLSEVVRLQIRPGAKKGIRLKLDRKAVKRVLRKGKPVKVSLTTLRADNRRKLSPQRVPFKLRR